MSLKASQPVFLFVLNLNMTWLEIVLAMQQLFQSNSSDFERKTGDLQVFSKSGQNSNSQKSLTLANAQADHHDKRYGQWQWDSVGGNRYVKDFSRCFSAMG